MNATYQLQVASNHLLSRSSFLRKEVDFLLKLIRKEYNTAINPSRLNMLECYWEIIERSVERLNMLNSDIMKNEEAAENIATFSANADEVFCEEERNINEIERITDEVRAIKESILEFVSASPDKP